MKIPIWHLFLLEICFYNCGMRIEGIFPLLQAMCRSLTGVGLWFGEGTWKIRYCFLFQKKLWFDCFIYDAALLKWNSDELDFFRTETMIITGALLRSGCITAWPGVGQYRSWFYTFYLQPWNNFRILFLSLVLIITVFLQRTTGDVPTKCSGSAACVLDDTMYVVAGFHR